MSDCLFCKIISGEIPSQKIYEDEKVIGFEDIAPQAKIHLLFINKKHTANINELCSSPDELQALFSAIKKYSEQEGLDQNGFRLVTNHGKLAGQTVFHTHVHLLAGEQLGSFGR